MLLTKTVRIYESLIKSNELKTSAKKAQICNTHQGPQGDHSALIFFAQQNRTFMSWRGRLCCCCYLCVIFWNINARVQIKLESSYCMALERVSILYNSYLLVLLWFWGFGLPGNKASLRQACSCHCRRNHNFKTNTIISILNSLSYSQPTIVLRLTYNGVNLKVSYFLDPSWINKSEQYT